MTKTPADAQPATSDYSKHVNAQWVRLLNLLQMNVRYRRCSGSELFREDGRAVLDFLSGYCVHNTGHNHPAIVQAIRDELDREGPAMLQSHVPELAGELARRLCGLAGGGLEKVFFACSGSEGVEAAIKFARKRTGRTALLYAKGAFHGLTCGALSLMDHGFWRDKFGPMLPETEGIAFGDLGALEQALSTGRYAAFVVEPVQSEAGIKVPDRTYLAEAAQLCRRHGALFVLDEVQTGMFRTGTFLAAHQFGVRPDIAILAKALSGGLVPVSAVLMTDEVYDSVYDSLQRAIVHTSTFGENAIAMRAGLATLDVLEREQLGERALRMGEELRGRLRESLSRYEMVKDVRGLGQLSGIEFQPPSSMRLRLPWEAFRRVHAGMFGQVVVMRMFRDWQILTQICGNNFVVLKVAPPLVVTGRQLDRFVEAITAVADLMHTSASFWSEALALGRRAVNVW
ncbi:MAG TPA: aspartate aminotransferase family protein [Bryobacteraceae bacterium]|nr:aspartate aminotransferase family protein [Bryobacteraceae bacterium]